MGRWGRTPGHRTRRSSADRTRHHRQMQRGWTCRGHRAARRHCRASYEQFVNPPQAITKPKNNPLCQVGRLFCEGRLLETEAGREHERRGVLLEQELNLVEEAREPVLVLCTNSHERGRNIRRQPDRVLDVKAL